MLWRLYHTNTNGNSWGLNIIFTLNTAEPFIYEFMLLMIHLKNDFQCVCLLIHYKSYSLNNEWITQLYQKYVNYIFLWKYTHSNPWRNLNKVLLKLVLKNFLQPWFLVHYKNTVSPSKILVFFEREIRHLRIFCWQTI